MLWGCMDLSTPLRLESTFTIGGSQSCSCPMHSMPTLQQLCSGSQRLKTPVHYCTTRDHHESLVIEMIQNEMTTMSQLLTTTTTIPNQMRARSGGHRRPAVGPRTPSVLASELMCLKQVGKASLVHPVASGRWPKSHHFATRNARLLRPAAILQPALLMHSCISFCARCLVPKSAQFSKPLTLRMSKSRLATASCTHKT